MGSSIGAGWLTTGSSSPQRRRGADRDVIEAFAALHDSCRLNDEDDAGHGERGGTLALELHAAGVLNLSDKQIQKLVSACRTHTDGMASSDPTIGVCFDADRLDLSRVGIRPEPRSPGETGPRDEGGSDPGRASGRRESRAAPSRPWTFITVSTTSTTTEVPAVARAAPAEGSPPAVSSTSCSKEPQPTVLSPRLSALSTIRLELLKLDAPHHPVLRFAKRRPGATPRGTPQPGRCPRGEIGRATEGALGTPFITRGLCLDHQPGKRNRCNRAQNRESKPDGHVRAPFRITEAEVLWAAPLNHSGRKPEVRRRRPRRRGPTFRFPSLRRIPGRAPPPRPGQESPAAFSSGVFPAPTALNKPRSSCRPS